MKTSVNPEQRKNLANATRGVFSGSGVGTKG